MQNKKVVMYKYQTEIDGLLKTGLQMPNGLHNPVNKRVFRFVFADPANPNNHKPVYIQNPIRRNQGTISVSGYALSCFETQQNAETKFYALVGKFPKFARTAGDSLCSGLLDSADGEITNSNNEGHLDLFEYPNCNLSTKFTVVKNL